MFTLQTCASLDVIGTNDVLGRRGNEYWHIGVSSCTGCLKSKTNVQIMFHM